MYQQNLICYSLFRRRGITDRLRNFGPDHIRSQWSRRKIIFQCIFRGGLHDQKHYLSMSDRLSSYLCRSEYTGSRVPISGMDDINVTSINAVRYAGDRIYCRLAINHAEAQKEVSR